MTYAAPTAERRVAPRAPWYGQALLHMQQRRLGCTVVDVSASGLLVVPPARAAKGAALEIDLMLPPHLEPVRLAAVVAREGDVHGHYAWGLRFVDPPPSSGNVATTRFRRATAPRRRARRAPGGPRRSGAHAQLPVQPGSLTALPQRPGGAGRSPRDRGARDNRAGC
ncbi:MAG: PilZ domain-containing protein, partial [Proteobacteria bacterium]|nr:PilZ domain-containing protein [Pseudomonadota bacterium]